MKLLMEQVGLEPLGEVVSQRVPKTYLFEGEVTRANSSYYPPEALKDILPEPWDERFNSDGPVKAEEFYRKVYDRYESEFDSELINTLVKTDQQVPTSRSDYGEVRTKAGVIGTWRMYHSSPFNYLTRVTERYSEPPFVRLNRARKVPDLKIEKVLRAFSSAGVGVTELGKFSVDSQDKNIRERATALVEMAWLARIDEDNVYIAHVTSRAHARLYRKYGFAIAEEFSVPGHSNPEAILWVRGHDFKKALEKLLGVQTDKIRVRPSDRRSPIRKVLPHETERKLSR
ncbi:MAG: hypothetical protein EOP05_01865 [Proteobacteria bacterium]|nr:MAG: hypothetical protein EOP05_01865 [Pseudomonadota bacterium]